MILLGACSFVKCYEQKNQSYLKVIFLSSYHAPPGFSMGFAALRAANPIEKGAQRGAVSARGRMRGQGDF